jgi:hypothetical protein
MSRFGLDVSSVLQFERCSRVLSKVAVRFGAIFLLASTAALTNGVPCAIAQNYIFDRGDFRVGNSPSADSGKSNPSSVVRRSMEWICSGILFTTAM